MAEKQVKVVEVRSGLCTETIRGPVVQKKINAEVEAGWTFKDAETVTGRWCCIQRYTMLLIFVKD